MTNHVQAEKATKIYIPKVSNPQILTFRNADPEMNIQQSGIINVSGNNPNSEKRR